MFILRIIGILIALAMAAAAVLAAIYASVVWAVIWTVGAIVFGLASLFRHKNRKQEIVHN